MLREGRPGDTHTAYSCSPCWLPGGALNTTIIKDRRSPPPGPTPPRCRPSVMTGVPRSRPGWRPSGEASSARGGGGPRLPWRAQVGPGVRSTCTRQGQGGWGGVKEEGLGYHQGPGCEDICSRKIRGEMVEDRYRGEEGGAGARGGQKGGGSRKGRGRSGWECVHVAKTSCQRAHLRTTSPPTHTPLTRSTPPAA